MSAQTDRELLELAAKAAGIELDWSLPDGISDWGRKNYSPWAITGEGEDRGPASQWNPLTDDGDAFRLAMRVQLSLDCWENGATVTYEHDGEFHDIHEAGEDPCAATRRAIVRAAAATGQKGE